MLPFHKRARANSSIEIDSDELEAIELPQVRPPSVRPGSFAPKSPMRQRVSSWSDDEMTVVRMDKRVSTSPPPRVDIQAPRIPPSYVPRFHDDEPTQLRPSSARPVLSMTSHTPPHSVILAPEVNHYVPPPPSSRRLVEEAPRSTAAVDVASSAHVRAVDLSMTSSVTGSTDIRNLRRPTMGWATALVALGVFAGIITAFVARGEGLATAASFIDPSHSVTADVAKAAAAQPQAPVMAPGAAVVQQAAPVQKPAAPSCNADAVPAKTEAKAETKVDAKVDAKETAKVERAVEKAEPKPEVKLVQRPVYTPPARHVEQVREPAAVAVSNPPPAITKPAAVKPTHKASANDMESASAADALAKAQLEAALSR